MDLLVFDNMNGCGITGKIILIINYIKETISNIKEIDNIYVIINNKEYYNMNCIFEKYPVYDKLGERHVKSIEIKTQIKINNKNIFKDNEFDKMRLIAKLIRFNKTLYTNDISNYELGIHIRLTDMNYHHGNCYGIVTYEDYINIIKNFLKSKSIFIAGDNFESLKNIHKYLIDNGYEKNNIYNNNNKILSVTQNDVDNLPFFNFNNKNCFIEVIKDIIELSKCNKLICRVSSVAYLSILLSDKITPENVFNLSSCWDK